ncbi:hypothetical protein V8245_04505 [Flavobacterium columnare]|uniref:hypothetical protein n=1 Tax=Flavobacterium TaxID=237 RepID=UPI0009810E3C|nr:hypothetical protein [Flavobacterium columnare]OOB82276.1 hypothetical protein BZL53_10700 [Flavobacterium columnare]OXA78182.1 hypothetical protein B0A56_09140 [Flavobacterium columnare NBRC 100251 = ATCC 23463]
MKKNAKKVANKIAIEDFEKFVGKVSIDKNLVSKVNAGGRGDGWIPSVSGDCMITPKNCWHLSTWFPY